MADAIFTQAAAYYGAGDFDAAARCALTVVAQTPDHFDALHLLGVICLNRGLLADAACYLERAAQFQPDHPLLSVNRGNAWLALHQFSRAETTSRRALVSEPGHLDALQNLAIALASQNRTQDAIEVYRTALLHKPDHTPALFNMAVALAALDRLGEAEIAYRTALRTAPPSLPPSRMANILSGLGGVLAALDRPEEALALFRSETAGRVEPLDLAWFTSLLHLQLGDYEPGWQAYESRWQVPAHDRPHANAVVPDIATVTGKRILVAGEQGRGDIVQFARYVPLLAERGATVYLAAYDDLKVLLSTLPGVAGVIGEDELEPPHDIVAQVCSLPLAFRTTVATIPANVPYLHADPHRAAAWRARLVGAPARHIGLVWSSTNPGAARSMDLARLGALLDCPNAVFHALQKDIGDADMAFMRASGRLSDHRSALTDFAETAALIEALDLVITIDSAVAHIAGAMGKPVWIMLPHVAEWRWLRSRTDSPWYPSARLYRQPTPGDWDGLVGQIAGALGN